MRVRIDVAGHGHQLLEQVPAFAQAAAMLPEAPDRAANAQAARRRARLGRPADRGAQVVVVGLSPRKGQLRPGAHELRLDRLGEAHEVLQVTIVQGVRGVIRGELLGGEGPDRVEQPVARFAAGAIRCDDEALVHERPEHADRRPG